MNEPNSSKTSLTDWEALEQMSDDEIDYSDVPPLTDRFFATARRRAANGPKVLVEMAIDSDVLAWFKSQQDGERLMQAALRIYVEAHQHA